MTAESHPRIMQRTMSISPANLKEALTSNCTPDLLVFSALNESGINCIKCI